MMFGDPSRFAIEGEEAGGSSRWCFAQLRFWAGGTPIGDYSDTVVLGAAVSYLRDFLAYSGLRHEPDFDGLSKERLFAAVVDDYFLDAVRAERSIATSMVNARDRFHLDSVGGASTDDVARIALVEMADGRQRLLWKAYEDGLVREVYLEEGEFERAAHAFLAEAEAWLRACGSGARDDMKKLSESEIDDLEKTLAVRLPALYRKLLVDVGWGKMPNGVEIYHPSQVRELYEPFFNDPTQVLTLFFPFGGNNRLQELWVIDDRGLAATIWHETVPDDGWTDETWLPPDEWMRENLPSERK